jgi:LPS-assembly protein
MTLLQAPRSIIFGLPRTLAAGVSALAIGALAASVTGTMPAAAQSTVDADGLPAQVVDTPIGNLDLDPNASMLLEADEIVYDFDNEIVSAVGNVQMYYDGFNVEADSISYKQNTGQLTANGNVKIVEPGGNVILSDSIDLAENLRDGFVQSLTVVTPDESRFGAASAERRGATTIFNRGTFTACPSCEQNPNKPLTWQIKAARVIYNQETNMVYYEGAQFEFLGMPIAYVPRFFHPGPGARRKSGFLAPELSFSEKRGLGVGASYFWVLGENRDLTITPVGYTKQGGMLKGRYRHRFENGMLRISGAGINQADRHEFDAPGNRVNRGMAEVTGEFEINEFWNWGFDGYIASDSTFVGNYDLDSETGGKSQVYLSGLSTRNYFDARLVHYDVLSNRRDFEDQLAVVHPVVDYNFVFGNSFLGGTTTFDANLTSISRERADVDSRSNSCAGAGINPVNCQLTGVPGSQARATAELAWRATANVANGHLVTPFASARADVIDVNVNNDPTVPVAAFRSVGNRTVGRGMAVGGMEWRYPLLTSFSGGRTVIQPIAQVIARPDEAHARTVLNEDAQSFVFDDTNLFKINKFSGYDRVEGGNRANLGFKTRTTFDNGMAIDTTFGQSYHLGGENPFDAGTGLETDRSDYVAGIYFSPQPDLQLAAKARFDESDFSVERAELQTSFLTGRVSGTVGYAYAAAQPAIGIAQDRQEIFGAGRYQIDDFWSVQANGRYDIAQNETVSYGGGITYDDLCFSASFTYERQEYSTEFREPDNRFLFRFSVKHLGDIGNDTRPSPFD